MKTTNLNLIDCSLLSCSICWLAHARKTLEAMPFARSCPGIRKVDRRSSEVAEGSLMAEEVPTNDWPKQTGNWLDKFPGGVMEHHCFHKTPMWRLWPVWRPAPPLRTFPWPFQALPDNETVTRKPAVQGQTLNDSQTVTDKLTNQESTKHIPSSQFSPLHITSFNFNQSMTNEQWVQEHSTVCSDSFIHQSWSWTTTECNHKKEVQHSARTMETLETSALGHRPVFLARHLQNLPAIKFFPATSPQTGMKSNPSTHHPIPE